MKWLEDKLQTEEFITTQDFYDSFNFRNVVGVSASGLKALAGPIYVVAVILSPTQPIEKLDKVKTLSDKEIDRLTYLVWERAAYVRVGVISNLDIINRGKNEGIQVALTEALLPFSKYNPVSCIILDTIKMEPMRSQFVGIPILSYPKITNRIECVSAAAIVAKQVRDAFMGRIHKDYPEYGWDNNSGFATKEHADAIKEHGVSIYHRLIRNKLKEI
jgi:ribonuclease HII